MRNILNYETKGEFQADGNIFPKMYWLRRDEVQSLYKEDYTPSRENTSDVYGPFNFKGMVASAFPGVAYIEECGTTFYNSTKFPYINLDEKLGGRQSAQFTWAELGITQDIYQAYKDEIRNNNPLCMLNVFFGGNPCNRIEHHNAFESFPGDIDMYFVSGTYILSIYANGTAEFHGNIG